MMRTGMIAAALASAMTGLGAAAADMDVSKLNPNALKYILPEKIDWQVTPAVDVAYLSGNPEQPGFYVMMIKWKPGNGSRPHYHSADRHALVLSGTWWNGTGTDWDLERNTAPMKPGTHVTHVARQVHYDGSRKGDLEPAALLLWGMGPVSNVACDGPNAEKGPGPCEDARRAAATASKGK